MSVSYGDQHATLVQLSRKIIDGATADTADGLSELARNRLALAKVLAEHVASETALIRADERPRSDARAALLARYHDELLAWRRQLVECNAHWPLAEIAKDPASFIAAYMPLHLALARRVRWEEDEFYPGVLTTDHLRKAA